MGTQAALIPNVPSIETTGKRKPARAESKFNNDLIRDPEQALQFTLKKLQPYAGLPIWIIPTSGGKDSRAVAQAILVLIKRGLIAPPQRILLIMANTLMEFPTFLQQARDAMQDMKQIGENMGIEMITSVVTPIPHHNFWFEILGRGFVPPTENMRRCTDHLKIEPMRRMVKQLAKQELEAGIPVPNLIGVRYGESWRRDMSLSKSESTVVSCTLGGECGPDYMLKHSIGAQKVTPIVEWCRSAVWDFLAFIAPAELGVNNQPMFDHYGGFGGNMRYGCWSCPLIFNDKTAEFLAQKDSIYTELITWTNENLRKGGSAWQSANREYRINGDGLLSLEYRQRLFAELLDIERRHGQMLLQPWEKDLIKGCWGWVDDLEDHQAGSAMQDTISLELAPPASPPLHINDIRPKTAAMLASANLFNDAHHQTIQRHARQLLHVAPNGTWMYLSSKHERGSWRPEDLATTWQDGDRIVAVRKEGIENY